MAHKVSTGVSGAQAMAGVGCNGGGGNRGRCLSDALQGEGVQPFLCRRCAALLRVRL